jgi:hypothetical protein
MGIRSMLSSAMMVVPGWSLAKGGGKVAGNYDCAPGEINTTLSRRLCHGELHQARQSGQGQRYCKPTFLEINTL